MNTQKNPSNESRKRNFVNEDLKSKDLSNQDLSGVVFENCILGISTAKKTLIFIISACLSLFAGFIAMRSGSRIQALLTAREPRLQWAGYIVVSLFIIFVVLAVWRGINKVSLKAISIMIALIVLIGVVSYFLDATAAGVGAAYGSLTLVLVLLMFIIESIARATAGSLQSTILFMIVAMGGGMFAKSLGGGIGTLIMTMATVAISKKALKRDTNSLVKYIAMRISTYFGTSFKNSNLNGATFRNMKLENCNFDGADLRNIKMENSTENLCYYGHNEITLKKY